MIANYHNKLSLSK